MRDEGDLNAELARRQAGDGYGRHDLGFSLRWTAAFAAVGAAIVVLHIYAHFYGRSIGVGIGLLIAAASQLIWRGWLDGPRLSYRQVGRRRVLDLRDVTNVAATTKGGQPFIQLSAPSLKKPLNVGLRVYEAAPEARAQLRFWLDAPHVHWSDEARAALTSDVGGQRAARQLGRVLLIGVMLLGLGVSGAAVLIHRRMDRTIAGAAGYKAVGGPHGRGLAVGRPWGARCQPVRFTVEASVPDWIYKEAASVVEAARLDGINVAMETRSFDWDARTLYFPPGVDRSTTPRVGIFARATTPSSGRFSGPYRIVLSWDAALDDRGDHEVLTYVQGVLMLEAINTSRPRVRRAIRNLIGLTQGIDSASRKDSVFARRAGADGPDQYSQQDIAAMRTMSGCGDTVLKRG